MKFTANLKPVLSGVDLGIINGNVGKFYRKSHLVELTITESGLRMNTESMSINTEIVFAGKSSGTDRFSRIFVDSKLFKKLLNTLSQNTVEFEIFESHLVIRSGKSEFKLPQIDVVSEDDYSLAQPAAIDPNADPRPVNPMEWEFVRRNQKYALSLSAQYPVYTYAWVGGKDGIITGDYGRSLFTHSNIDALDGPCLLSYTILNLLSSVPAESTICRSVDKSYIIEYDSDPFTYKCEFVPQYEDEDMSYNADVLLDMFSADTSVMHVEMEQLRKLLAQAELFTSALYFKVESIEMKFDGETLEMCNKNVSATFDLEPSELDNDLPEPFECEFDLRELKGVLSHISDMDEQSPDIIDIRPMVREGDGVVAVRVETPYISTIIATRD